MRHLRIQEVLLCSASEAAAPTAPEVRMIEILTVIAIARVTRLITRDALFDTPRTAAAQWLIRPGRARSLRDHLAYLILCPWCMSIYVGAAAAYAYAQWHATMPYMTVVLALAASHVTGFLASKEGEG